METTTNAAMAFSPESGVLYIVATPLGNMRDISLRALDVLRQVDRIAAEDTRVTIDLLRAHALPHRPLLSIREHNEREAAQTVIAALGAGESIAYVSDAGTPGVSDPGARLVASVREAGFRIVPIPGASAITALLSVSGFVDSGFIFLGFLPHATAARAQQIGDMAHEPRAQIFYESTHRLLESAQLLGKHCAGRTIVIGKELTKTYETIAQMPAEQLFDWLSAVPQRQRGEFVLALAPLQNTEIAPQVGEAKKWLAALSKELPPARAAKIVAQMTGVPRDALYRSLRSTNDEANDEQTISFKTSQTIL